MYQTDSILLSPQVLCHLTCTRYTRISLSHDFPLLKQDRKVAGGSRFSATYNYTDLITSQCSTIMVPTDKSNYWTVRANHISYWLLLNIKLQPKLYYRDLNANTFTPIRKWTSTLNRKCEYSRHIANSFNIYYLARPGPNNDKVHAFPTGLRVSFGRQNENERKLIIVFLDARRKPPSPCQQC